MCLAYPGIDLQNRSMKRTLVLLILLTASSLSFAADVEAPLNGTDGQDAAPAGTTGGTDLPFNIIKMNASALVVKNFSFQYERILARRMSVAIGLRLMPKSGLPFRNTIEKIAEEDNADNSSEISRFLKETRMGGFAITPEFRYYLGKGYGQGFYIAPFLRYERFNISSVYPYENKNKITTDINFTGHYKTFGIGVLLGSQFRLSNRLTLDWWILGPYYTAPRINQEGVGYNLSAEDQKDLKSELEDTKIEIGSFKINASVDGNKAEINTKGSLAAIRGFGLCLGVRF